MSQILDFEVAIGWQKCREYIHTGCRKKVMLMIMQIWRDCSYLFSVSGYFLLAEIASSTGRTRLWEGGLENSRPHHAHDNTLTVVCAIDIGCIVFISNLHDIPPVFIYLSRSANLLTCCSSVCSVIGTTCPNFAGSLHHTCFCSLQFYKKLCKLFIFFWYSKMGFCFSGRAWTLILKKNAPFNKVPNVTQYAKEMSPY